ncbi:MAG: right-handed parallel beta-helix repeat-containing protein [Calothrix sp. FI2-JRJ7]|jgi:Ca2+-binding RTX toxin-like protein|nr:right-handed parallel beta-helix repeat-containing protein [Calothrix sp. FI2-JRJ7]
MTQNSNSPITNLPLVSFTADKTFIQEGEEFSWFFRLDQPVPAGGLTLNIPILDNNDPSPGDINFNIAGSTNVTNFAVVREKLAVVGFQVTLAEGATEARLVNRGALDNLVDIDEIATVALAQSSNYAVDPTQKLVSFTIDDPVGTPTEGAGGIPDGTPFVSFTADKTIVQEGETFTWNFNLSEPAPAGGLILNLPILDNNDPAPGDIQYNIEGSTNISGFEFIVDNGVSIGYRVTVPEGVTEAKLVSRALVDTTIESNEIFTTALAQGVNYAPSPTAKLVPLTISELPISTNFVVNSLVDVISATDGAITLREAINAANSQAGQNTITFNLASGFQIDLTGLLEITDDLIINGNGVTVAGNGSFDNFFIKNANVIINGLTIANGEDGIAIGGDSNLTLTNSILSNNANDGIDIGGNNNSITLSGVSVTGNGDNGVEADATNSIININNSSFVKNGTDGLSFDEGGNNIVNVSSSSFINNTGDGIDVNSGGNSLNLSSVTLAGNGEDGFEVDGNNNKISISNSSLNNNTNDGFNIDAGSSNTVNFNSVELANNKGDGIDVVTANNNINLANFNVSGNSEDGVEIDGGSNTLTATNGSFSNNTGDGVDFNGSNNIANLSGIGISGNTEDGIEISPGSNNNILNVSNAGITANTGDGIDVNGNNNAVTVTGSSLSGNGVGAALEPEDGFEVDGNNNSISISNSSLNNNESDGFNIDTGSSNTVNFNSVELANNKGDGIDIVTANNNVSLANFNISGNSEDGVEIDGGSNTLTASNGSFTNNKGDGVDFNGSNNTANLSSVAITGNGEDGVEISPGSNNNTLNINNAGITANTGDGIDVNGNNNNVTVTGSSLSGNGVGAALEPEDGFEVDGNNNSISISNSSLNNNESDGFNIDTGSSNTVNFSGVELANNKGDGIDIVTANNNVSLTNFNVSGNSEDGIELDGGFNTLTASNGSFSNNTGDGVDFNGSNNIANLSSVGISGNGEDGIEISPGSNNNTLTVTNSTVSNNAGEAIANRGNANTVNIIDQTTGKLTTATDQVVSFRLKDVFGSFVYIDNASFEEPVLADNTFTVTPPPGWQLYNPFGSIPQVITNESSTVGAFNPSTDNYPNGIPDGQNVGYAFLIDKPGSGFAGIAQTLDTVVAANTRYTLTVGVGNPTGADIATGLDYAGFSGYRVELRAGDEIVAVDNNSLNIGEGKFATSTISFTAATSESIVGKNLTINLINELNGEGIEVDFDNVSLKAEAVTASAITGNQTLYGSSGTTTLNGGLGNDIIFGNGFSTTLFGRDGNDQLFGASTDDYIGGGAGNDTIYGNGGKDILLGDAGDDVIFGGSQTDIIFGGAGNDTIYGNGGGDFIDGGTGFNTIFLGAGDATVALNTGEGFDTINNFQLGSSRFFVGSLLNDLSFADSSSGVRISAGNDLLAVVSNQTASNFINNTGKIFTA